MSLLGYLRIVRSQWIVALAVLLVIMTATGLWLALTPRTYSARTAVLVSADVPGGGSRDLRRAFGYAAGLTQLSVGLAQSPVVLDPVITRLGLDTSREELASDVTARVEPGTLVVSLTADADSPQRATAVVDAVADELTTTLGRLLRADGTGAAAFTVSVTGPAGSRIVATPRIGLTLALALLFGSVLGAAAAIARADRETWIGRTGLAALTTAPVLGVLRDRPRWWTRRSPTTMAGDEAIDEVRTGFLHLRRTAQVRSVLVVATADVRAGARAVRRLGISLAERDLSVLMIDADLRGASLSRCFHLPGGAGGLAAVLAGESDRQSEMRLLSAEKPLWLLPAGGPAPVDGGAALASTRMADVLEQVADDFDVLLVNIPPVGLTSDGLALTDLVDGVILVADAPRLTALAGEIEILERVDADIVGVVLDPGRRRLSDVD